MDEPELNGFQARLRKLIGSDSVSRFAADCGLGDNLVRKYLEGATPGLDKAVRICRSKGANLIWLATGQGEMYGEGARMALAEPAREYVVEEFVEVPHFSVRASAGLGVESEDPAPTHFNKFRRDWWTRKIAADPDTCFSLDVEGDSMAPRITDRDLTIVDRSQSEVLSEAIFVFRLDGRVFVKYLERAPGKGLIARSENPRYEPFEIGDGSQFSDFRIIGRAIYKGSGERL